MGRHPPVPVRIVALEPEQQSGAGMREVRLSAPGRTCTAQPQGPPLGVSIRVRGNPIRVSNTAGGARDTLLQFELLALHQRTFHALAHLLDAGAHFARAALFAGRSFASSLAMLSAAMMSQRSLPMPRALSRALRRRPSRRVAARIRSSRSSGGQAMR